MDLCYAGNESISRLISNSGNERVLALTRETETYHHSLHKIAKTSNLFLVWRTKLRRGGKKVHLHRNQMIFTVFVVSTVHEMFNSLPNGIFLEWSKLKAFAVDNLYVAQMMIYVFDRVENIVGNGENAGFQHFLLFPHCFLKLSFSGSLKVVIVW